MSEEKPKKYWTNLDNARREAREIMREYDFEVLPSSSTLGRLRCSSLASAIKKYHGGFRRFRELLGQEQIQKSNGYWVEIENAILESESIIEEHGFDVLPGQVVLGRLGYSSLVTAINNYHGGLPAFRKLLGQKQIRKPFGYWQNLENTLREAEKIMEEQEIEVLPGGTTLKKMGHSGLTNAIHSYHGGMRAFRELLKQRQGLPTEEKRLESLLQEYVGGVE